MLDVTDYELVWPPELFAAEARRLLSRPRLSRPALYLLLREAFRDESAADDLSSLAGYSFAGADPWDSDPPLPSPSDMLAERPDSAHGIRRSSAPCPYWPQRQKREEPGPYLDLPGVRRAFVSLVGEPQHQGYLDQVFPRPCVDDRDRTEPDQATELEKRLGTAGLWPLAP